MTTTKPDPEHTPDPAGTPHSHQPVRTDARTDVPTPARPDGRTGGRADRRTDGHAGADADGHADRHTHARTDERAERRADERTAELAYERVEGRANGRADGPAHAHTDGSAHADGSADGHADAHRHADGHGHADGHADANAHRHADLRVDADGLQAVCGAVERLVAGAPGVGRVRVRAGELDVEVEWPRVAAAGAPGGVAASGVHEGGAPHSDASQSGAPGSGVSEDGLAEDVRYLRAPAVGTFYRAPEPGAAPYVDVGDEIAHGQQLGILEAMKLMNPIEADGAGLITKVLAGDGEPVEYDQPLFAYRTDRRSDVLNGADRQPG